MKIEIDVEQFANDLKAGKSIGGANGALGSLIKQLLFSYYYLIVYLNYCFG